MKKYLLFGYMLVFGYTYSFGQSERQIINQIDSINTLALNHYNNNDLVKSFSEFNKSIKLSDSLNDDYGNAVANFTLGKIYFRLQKYKNAEACFLKMKMLSQKTSDSYLIANAYLYLGELYTIYNKTSNEVIPFFKKANQFALALKEQNLNKIDNEQDLLFNIYINLSKEYLKGNKLNNATENLLKAQNILPQLGSNNYYISEFNYLYGDLYLKKNLFNLASNKFKMALKVLKNTTNNQDNNLLLSKIYKDYSVTLEKLDQKDLAFNMLKRRENARDKYLNEEKIKQENIIESNFYIDLNKQEAKWAKEEQILQNKVAQKINTFNIYISIAVLLLSISFVTLLINYNSKRKLSNALIKQNENLEKAKNLAEESTRLKTKFISNVSHELRTPLYGVVGLTSIMLKNSNLSGQDAKYLKSLKYSGDYLLNLINDILQISKMESNKIELNNASVEIKSLIQNIVDSFDYRLEESGNKIHVTLDDCLPKFIECDKIRLTQVLFNLIGNSIKFTENGNIYLKVILLNKQKDDVTLRFEVHDDGMGIPEEKQATIFENFSQLSENSNINYQGTGLGLSITKKLIELFNSKIELQSTVGKGSVFSFNANFKIDQTGFQDKTKPVTKALSRSAIPDIKILIAEDNKINQIVTGNLLERENYNYDIVQNGLEAVEAFKKDKYDLVLMDINMPVMNGKEATLEIRKFDSQVPIVALTASNNDEIKNSKQNVGFNDVITKPFDTDMFFRTISQLVKGKGKRRKEYGGKVLELAS